MTTNADLSLFDDPKRVVSVSSDDRASGARVRLSPLALDALHLARVVDVPGGLAVDFPPVAAATYAELKPALASAGFVWNSKRKTHLGSVEDAEELDRIRESGSFYDSKHALEFFATSQAGADVLARLLASEIDHLSTPRVLEPSAGDGALCDAVLRFLPTATITAVEVDPRRARALRAKYENDERISVLEDDILRVERGDFDAVIINPPFADALAHICHAYSLLRRGGAMIGIASLERREDRDLALWLNDRDAWTDTTDQDTFVDTNFRASFFGLRAEASWFDRLRKAVEPYQSLREPHLRRLTRISRDLHELATAYCNGEIESDSHETQTDALLDAARAIVAHESIGVLHASDPRAGHGLRLILPNGATNDFGGTGIIVPDALVGDVDDAVATVTVHEDQLPLDLFAA